MKERVRPLGRKDSTMKWLTVGMRKEFVESFVQWMKENGVCRRAFGEMGWFVLAMRVLC